MMMFSLAMMMIVMMVIMMMMILMMIMNQAYDDVSRVQVFLDD